MEYIKQINAFWAWRSLNDISHTQVDLYFALLDTFNKRQRPDELAIPNRTLMSAADIQTKAQLAKERAALVDLGLIRYVSGERGKAGIYSIVILYDNEADNETTSEAVTNQLSKQLQNSLPYKEKEIEKEEEKEYTHSRQNAESDRAKIQAVFDAFNAI